MRIPPAWGVRRAFAALLAANLAFAPPCVAGEAPRLVRAHRQGRACGQTAAAGMAEAAARNRRSLYAKGFNLFGRPETGWAVYAPAIEHQVDVLCPADSPGFAEALARWSVARGGDGAGAVTPELLDRLKADWQARRPFVQLRAQGLCPPPPQAAELAVVPAGKSYGKTVALETGALAAWTRLARDARWAQPRLAARPELLRVFSGYRSPEYDAARRQRENNCRGTVRAACSAHRTGRALDVVLDTAPAQAVDSSVDANRLAMTQGLAYRWLVANAGRYGFVNYVFEPWHWEWIGRPSARGGV